MKYHKQCSKSHARQVWDYREERQRQEMVAEEVSLGYETEYQEYVNKHPLITFKDWLIGGSNRGGTQWDLLIKTPPSQAGTPPSRAS